MMISAVGLAARNTHAALETITSLRGITVVKASLKDSVFKVHAVESHSSADLRTG